MAHKEEGRGQEGQKSEDSGQKAEDRCQPPAHRGLRPGGRTENQLGAAYCFTRSVPVQYQELRQLTSL